MPDTTMPDVLTAAPATDDATLATWAKALAHPARLQILRTLGQRGTCVCGDLVDEMPLAQSTVSQHLKVLKEAGLVRGEVDGPRSCYCLDGGALEAARAAFGGLFAALEPASCAGPSCACS